LDSTNAAVSATSSPPAAAPSLTERSSMADGGAPLSSERPLVSMPA